MITTTVPEQPAEKKRRFGVLSVIGIVLCVVLVLMLVCNLAIIIQGSLNPDEPPKLLGVTPLVVLTDSMSGDAEDHIEGGDLIIVNEVNTKDLKKGDIITYKEGSVLVTHRIIEVQDAEEGDGLQFITKGDFNNTEDKNPVTEDKVVGIYSGTRVPYLGQFAMFLQQPLGMLIFIGVPVLAFVIYSIIKRQVQLNREGNKSQELEAELERLRALAGEGDAPVADEPAQVAAEESAE